MIRKTSLIIFLFFFIFVQSSIFGFLFPVYLSFQVIFILLLFILMPDISLWIVFFLGFVSDLIMFRPIGLSILVLILTTAIFKALNIFIGAEGFLFRIINLAISLFFGLLVEFVLLALLNNLGIDILPFVRTYLLNLLALPFCSILLLIIKPILLKNA